MSYEKFAYYYDSLMDPQFYDDYLVFIKKHTDHVEEILELGCGTSELAIRLSKAGYRIFATDLSNDMIEVSKQKAMYENVDLMLQKVDMTDFSTSYQLDLILCLCDSLNYIINEDDIIKTFKNVFMSLKNDGYFIFDVNSLYKMNVILDDYIEQEEDEEFSFKWSVKNINEGEVIHDVYILDKLENELVEETHHQKTYAVSQYKKWLNSVGFTNIELYSDFKEYKEECERIIFVCRKD